VILNQKNVITRFQLRYFVYVYHGKTQRILFHGSRQPHELLSDQEVDFYDFQFKVSQKLRAAKKFSSKKFSVFERTNEKRARALTSISTLR